MWIDVRRVFPPPDDNRSDCFYRLAEPASWTAVRGSDASSISLFKMATPGELSLEEIRNYLLENGGTARNHDLVKHFKRFLTDPETRGGLNFRLDAHIRGCLVARRRLALRFCDVNTCDRFAEWASDLSMWFCVTVEARNRFKEYVNTLATIKNEEVGYADSLAVAFRFLDRSDLLRTRRRCRFCSRRQLKNSAPSYYRRVIVII